MCSAEEDIDSCSGLRRGRRRAPLVKFDRQVFRLMRKNKKTSRAKPPHTAPTSDAHNPPDNTYTPLRPTKCLQALRVSASEPMKKKLGKQHMSPL
jgi:hypothetical protein